MEFEAIGTHWTIKIYNQISDSQESDIFASVRQRIDTYDKHYSRFRPDSLIAQMAREPGIYTLPEDAKPLFDTYEKIYKCTHGLVTPLIGNALSDAGYDASYSLETKEMSSPPAWEDALDYAFPKLVIKQPVLIDVGAAGKGYLIDIVADLLKEQGLTAFMINAGGDIVHVDGEEHDMRVGLEHPLDTSSVIGIAEIENESICGSAGNRRKWGRFHHILNPHTLTSPDHILGVWVVANTGLVADALTTCLFFVEPEVMESVFSFDYIIYYTDQRVRTSPHFRGELLV